MNTNLAEKFETIDPAIYSVQAMGFPGLSDKGQWLLDQLRPRFPNYQDPQIMNWLRSVIDSPDYHFVRTEHAVALSELKRERMMAAAFVLDHFVLIEEGADISEGEALYDDMRRWAFGLGAAEIVVNPQSHVPVEMVEARIGKVRKRETLYVKVGKN